jgi:hypothetical protein
MRSKSHTPAGHRWPNTLASCVLSGAIGIAYFNADPMIAGTEPTARIASLDAQPVLSIPRLPGNLVPAPAEPTPSADSGAVTGSAAAPATDPALRGRWALQMNVTLLEMGLEKFEDVDSYTFTLTRQERVGGDLLEPQVMNVKLRNEPFSVYMKWILGDKGRQVIYVEGLNDGKLLVRPGGIKGRLTGTLPLSIDDSLVMAECRHPINQCGLRHLAEKIVKYQQQDLANNLANCTCEMYDDQTVEDRPCFLFIAHYRSPETNPVYRKVMMYIDKELCLPIAIRNYTWGTDIAPEELDALTLIESYTYTEISTATQLAAEDFDRENAKYKMR